MCSVPLIFMLWYFALNISVCICLLQGLSDPQKAETTILCFESLHLRGTFCIDVLEKIWATCGWVAGCHLTRRKDSSIICVS